MKFLIIFCTIPAFASNWMHEQDLSKAKLNQSYKVFSAEQSCAAEKKGKCVKIDGVNIMTHDLEDVALESNIPVYGQKTKQTNCAGPAECQSIISQPNWCAPGFKALYEKNAILPGYEAYCGKQTGTVPVIEKRFIANEPLQEAWDAKIASEAQERQSKQNAKALLKGTDPASVADPVVRALLILMK